MTSQKGFTLTELITVVAVATMMAAFAVPRYVALNTESRLNSVLGLAVHVEGSARLINRVWTAAGEPESVVIEGRVVDVRHGYPTDQSIENVVINNGDYQFSDGYWKHQGTSRDDSCAVLYIPPAADGGQYQVISYTDGC